MRKRKDKTPCGISTQGRNVNLVLLMDFVSPFYENRYQNEHIVQQRDVVPNDGADVPTEGAEEMMSLTILECLFVSISGNS